MFSITNHVQRWFYLCHAHQATVALSRWFCEDYTRIHKAATSYILGVTFPQDTYIEATNQHVHAEGSRLKMGVTMKSEVILDTDYRLAEDEPFMNERQVEYFRRKLAGWKTELLEDTKDTIEDMQEGTRNIPDVADRASEETDRALELRTRDRQRKLVSKIDQALRRIEEGEFGYCSETGNPISLKRLDARPIATMSLEAQERHERKERVHRDT